MEIPTIIFILIILIIIVLLIYYLYLVHKDSDLNREIPYDLLYEQDITITELLKYMSERYGDKTALKYKTKNDTWKEVNYRKYYSNCQDLAKQLLYRLGPYPRAVILSHNRPEWFYVHLGTMMASGISIGLYPSSSADNCEKIINHACGDVLFVEDNEQLSKFYNMKLPTVKLIVMFDSDTNGTEYLDIVDNIHSVNKSIIIVNYKNFINDELSNYRTETFITMGTIDPIKTATIIYTSGTTGDPKGVMLSHYNIIASIRNCINAIITRSSITLTIQERYISYLPLNHIAAQLMDIYIPIASLGTVYFAPKGAIKGKLKDTIKDVKPTIFVGVPSVWDKIMEAIKERQQDPERILNKLFVNKMIIKEIGFDKCKYCISSASSIRTETKDFLNNLGLELCDVYGMTETTGPISLSVPGQSKGVGVPLIDVKIDPSTSEILVRGDSVFSSYYKNDNETIIAFTDKKKKWLKTGDLGYVDRDGTLYITGRLKDIIVTYGGENVSPLPIEDHLYKLLNKTKKIVDYVVVVGDNKKYISCLIFSNSLDQKSNSKLIDSVINEVNNSAPNKSSMVKKYKVINTPLDPICITPTLKIKRNEINKIYSDIINYFYE